MKALTLSFARKAVVATVIAILILTVLEFPPPIGFETRPQSEVSSFWLVFFLIILIVEIATIPMIYKRQSIGSGLGIFAAILNIVQVIADQAHLMQPEVAPLGYSLLEGMVVIASLALVYLSWHAKKPAITQRKTQNEMRNQ
jgi:cytochrome bd-type quinol oxidase subunit 2